MFKALAFAATGGAAVSTGLAVGRVGRFRLMETGKSEDFCAQP